MNIFAVHEDPIVAAQMLCDRHVVKMTLETAQMLCTTLHDYSIPSIPYKRTHAKHPCTIWAMRNQSNFGWLVNHGLALGAEYTRRYGKTHKSARVIAFCSAWKGLLLDGERTPFAQAMPAQYKNPSCGVSAYRAYYRGDKAGFATWKAPSSPPDWW